MTKNHCFVYNREKDEFQEIEKNETVEQYFSYLGQEPDKLETFASQNGNDAVLLFDPSDTQWILVYAKGSGIVSQRIARRKADSVSRTGIRVKSGERIGVNTPLTVLSGSNIGDLSKSVQSKYLQYTDLRGIE
ncbi:MAG: hypothetical protein U9O98_05465 [Asgard group archaeon]|nr:hypothetical protein [Asgard group archaeon]